MDPIFTISSFPEDTTNFILRLHNDKIYLEKRSFFTLIKTILFRGQYNLPKITDFLIKQVNSEESVLDNSDSENQKCINNKLIITLFLKCLRYNDKKNEKIEVAPLKEKAVKENSEPNCLGKLIDLNEANSDELNNENSQKLLSKVIKKDLLEAVDFVWKKIGGKINVNEKNEEGKTPLMVACRYATLDVIKFFIEKGADVNTVDNEGKTPLMVSCMYVDPDKIQLNEIQFLVKNGVNVNAVDKKGKTPLMVASKYADLSVIKFLVKNGAEVNAVDKEGKTPLMVACEHANLSVIEFLVKNGAEVNAVDKEGKTPLMVACKNPDLSVIDFLIQKESDVNAKNKKGETPLMVACHSGDLELIKYLLDNSANVNAKTIKNETALMMATQNAITNEKLKESGKIRLQENPEDFQIDINSLEATCLNDLNIIKLLLEKGADIQAKNDSGKSVRDLIKGHALISDSLRSVFMDSEN